MDPELNARLCAIEALLAQLVRAVEGKRRAQGPYDRLDLSPAAKRMQTIAARVQRTAKTELAKLRPDEAAAALKDARQTLRKRAKP